MLISDDQLVQNLAKQVMESTREIDAMFSPEVWKFLESRRLRKVRNGAPDTLPIPLGSGNSVEDNAIDGFEGQDVAVQS